MTISPQFITVVSGLPRSGTSLVMQMLAAGGMSVLADDLRPSDLDNPAGYFEFDPVKRTRTDATWVRSAVGKAVKVIYLLLPDLPRDYPYRVIFMRRNLDEVIASQRSMLERRGESGAGLNATEMARVFERQLEKTEEWLDEQPSFSVLFLNYRDVVDDPMSHAEKIRDFLNFDLMLEAMCAEVKPHLYRQRSP